MGLIFSRKKKKSTKEVLEDLEKDIRKIEEYRQHTEQKQKRTIGKLLLYGIPLYGLVALCVYFYEFPRTFFGKIFAVTPLLILPILFVLIRRLLTWYFRRQITHNEEKLNELYAKKRKILEDVMETETYKVAKEILEKFAPDQLRNKGSPNGNQENAFAQTVARSRMMTPQQSNMELRRRNVQGSQAAPPMQHSPGHQPGPRPPMGQRGSPPGPGMGRAGMQTPMPPPSISPNGQRGFGRGVMFPRPPGPPMPRPIPPYERSFMDRMVEYLVGDGPSNRYALICRQCESHNGMALREEFEYLSFRCCYCYCWNPSRKQRPHAPKLPMLPPPRSPESGQKEDGGGEESGSEDEGSDETSSDGPSGEAREASDGDARESPLGGETVSEGAVGEGPDLTGSEETPASSSSVSPTTEEGSGGDAQAPLESAASADSGSSSRSQPSEEQAVEDENIMQTNPLEL